MSASLSRLGAGAGRLARFQASRAAQAMAAGQTEIRGSHAMLRSEDNDVDVPSLRIRLEHDISAMEWDTFASAVKAQNDLNARSYLRSGTTAVAARLAKAAECSLEPNTPRYLSSAMDPSSQCRLVVSAEPPYRVVHASPAWQDLTGFECDAAQGRPALSVLLAAQASTASGISSLMASMNMHSRGAATVACRTAPQKEPFPAKVTVSPLMDTRGEVSHMLCVVRPLAENRV